MRFVRHFVSLALLIAVVCAPVFAQHRNRVGHTRFDGTVSRVQGDRVMVTAPGGMYEVPSNATFTCRGFRVGCNQLTSGMVVSVDAPFGYYTPGYGNPAPTCGYGNRGNCSLSYGSVMPDTRGWVYVRLHENGQVQMLPYETAMQLRAMGRVTVLGPPDPATGNAPSTPNPAFNPPPYPVFGPDQVPPH